MLSQMSLVRIVIRQCTAKNFDELRIVRPIFHLGDHLSSEIACTALLPELARVQMILSDIWLEIQELT